MLKRIKNFFDQHLAPDAVGGDQDSEHALRLAVGALLIEMTHMDGEVWPEQRQAVEESVLEHFDLAEGEAAALLELAEAEHSDSTDYFQFTSLINGAYSPEQKVKLVELLWRIAYANEDLHRYEEHLVRKVAEKQESLVVRGSGRHHADYHDRRETIDRRETEQVIARDLGVDYLLKGSVRRAGGESASTSA